MPSEELPDTSDREVVQMMAAQAVVMDHYEQLDAEYKEKVKEFAERYDVDHELLDQ
jgi:transposase